MGDCPMAYELRLQDRKVKTAIAIALGTLCSAGAPCCKDGATERLVGTVDLLEADGGVIDVDAAGDAGVSLTYERCQASCEKLTGSRAAGVTCRLASHDSASGDSSRRVDCVRVESLCSQPAGRRHARVRPGAGPVEPNVASHLAEVAVLEAISVHAFVLLARDLRHHRAPAALVRAAERAQRD